MELRYFILIVAIRTNGEFLITGAAATILQTSVKRNVSEEREQMKGSPNQSSL